MIFLTDLSFFYYANFFSLSPIVYNDLLSSRHTDSCSLSFWMVQMDARTASLIPMVVYFRKSDDHYIPFITYVWIFFTEENLPCLFIDPSKKGELRSTGLKWDFAYVFSQKKKTYAWDREEKFKEVLEFWVLKNWNEKTNLFSYGICMDKTPFSRLLCQ